jgi:CRISPR-associated protein Csd1
LILQRIVEFAERQGSSLPTGYQPRFVTKEIALDAKGGLRDVVALSGETRGKRHGRTRPEPQESPMRTVAVKPRLFADNVNYALGKAREKDKPEKVAERHKAWKALVREAAVALTETLEAGAVLAWVDGGGPGALADDPRIEEDDEMTISVDGKFVTDIEAVRRFWAARGAEGQRAFCLVTGEVTPVVDRMPAPIRGVPDGQMSGTALISVNNVAGESYGLEAALNSPISANAAEKLCNGLNVLLNEEAGTDDRGRRKFRYALRVGKAVYVAWCREQTEWNPLGDMDDPDPEHVRAYIELARKGGLGSKPDAADFYVLSLSANAARIVVRDYHETTLDNVKANLGKWFQRLQIVGTDGQPARPMGVYRLAASLYRDANKEMPAHVPTALLNAALTGRPIPEYILGLGVKRNLAMQGPFYTTKAKTKAIATSRLALIKAVLAPEPEDTTLNQLNTENPNPAYHCGRMLAVLEAIQRVAIPGLNATLTDRHYGAACASPATVFGNLLKDATAAHLPKLRKNRPGAHYALDQRLQEVAGSVGAEFPRTLTLKDQALFALGYYHQKAHDTAEARKNKELKELAEAATTQTEDTAE